MLKIIESFPDQCAKAIRIGASCRPQKIPRTSLSNIVITGMGGSAIGGDILRSYLSGDATVPIIVNRSYTLPAYVNRTSLVIASSYSGNTEETLSAYRDARAKGARLAVITSGGELRRRASRDGVPVIEIPAGLPPRAALGFSFFPLMALITRAGAAPDRSGEAWRAVEMLAFLRDHSLGPAVPDRANPAKRIASQVAGRIPFIYGSQDHIDAVAIRWRGQFEENAKQLASHNTFPEMNHNEIMGWGSPKKLMKGVLAVILQDIGDHSRITKRMTVTARILESEGIRVIRVESVGKGLLSRIFSLIYIGDFASYYLSILNAVDPMPVERINCLKAELAKL